MFVHVCYEKSRLVLKITYSTLLPELISVMHTESGGFRS